MARRKRNSKGQFKKGRGGKRVTRSRRRKSVGAIGSPMVDAFVSPMVGGGIAAATALAIRKFVDPTGSEMRFRAVKWAGLVGMLFGGAASGALYFFAGRDMQTLVASLSGTALAGLALTVQDQAILNSDEGMAVGAALAASNYAALSAGPGAAADNGTAGLFGPRRPARTMALAGIGSAAHAPHLHAVPPVSPAAFGGTHY